MRPSTLIVVVAVLMVGMRAHGSRLFTAGEYLRYSGPCAMPPCSPFFPPIGELGISVWIKPPIVEPTGVQKVLYNVDTDDEGMQLTYSAPSIVTFKYRGPIAIGPGQPSPIEVSADLGIFQPVNGWYHVAVSLRLADPSRARLFINGTLADQFTLNALIGPLTGSPHLYVGAAPCDPADLFSPPCDGFEGDVHDICMIDRTWGPGEIQDLQTQAARDIDPGGVILFNPQLRRFADDPFTGIAPTIVPVGTYIERGMGPPIIYAGQLPTILVIGDTQGLDHEPGICDIEDFSMKLNDAPEMLDLGAFVSDYQATLNIQAAFHVGDWINCGNQNLVPKTGEETGGLMYRARALAQGLDEAGVPWACTIGNHDYQENPESTLTCQCGAHVRDLAPWRLEEPWAMPSSLFTTQSWHRASMSDGGCQLTDPPQPDADYAYSFVFDLPAIDGQGNLTSNPQFGITVPHSITNGVKEWIKCQADQFAVEHENGTVWLVTHWFLAGAGGLNSEPPNTFGGEPKIYQGISSFQAWTAEPAPLETISNLGFVFCGHVVPGPYAAAHSCQTNKDTGDPVHMLLVNGQGAPGGGGGFLQILTVLMNPQGGIDYVDVETYIPLEDRFYEGQDGTTPLENYTFTLTTTGGCP